MKACHEGLSSSWFITPRGISATRNMKSRLAIKFPPSRAGKDVKCPGYARGGMLKLRFDWYIKVGEHSGFVHRKIIRLIQYSWNCGFGQGKVMQQVGCITIFLCSMVATCESNENGPFSSQSRLAKPSLKGKSKMLVFSERENHFEKKNTVCLYSC